MGKIRGMESVKFTDDSEVSIPNVRKLLDLISHIGEGLVVKI